MIDLRSGSAVTRQIVLGASPSMAAARVLGEPVVRSGAARNLIAKAYFINEVGERNMVRLYRTVDTEARMAAEANSSA